MREIAKNLLHKEYNPCGNLTGREREICDSASKNFFTLPYQEVMRSELARVLSKIERENKFRNVRAIEHWSAHNLNEIEQRAVITFKTSSKLQIGLAKYLTHVLYENRYNIHYNELIDYCQLIGEDSFPSSLTSEKLEWEINFIVQNADYSSTYDELNEKLTKSFKEFVTREHIDNFFDGMFFWDVIDWLRDK